MVTLASGAERYEVVEILGKGTFGEVAKGRKLSTGEPVALKVLADDAYRHRIVRNELKLLRALGRLDPEAAHVVRFHEGFQAGGKCYLVFELLEKNLFDFQKENGFAPLPVRHIRTVTAQVLRALAKLKELAVIHADLKPENIMLVDQARRPFRVKVIDFGSASFFPEVRYVREPYIQSRFYRAPEVLLGLPFCEKVDVWSLGCVVAELHLGWPLYPGGSEYDQVRYICETQGLPKGGLLGAASKAPLFFKRAPQPEGGSQWQLKAPAEAGVKAVERRKYVLRSLEQLEAVPVPRGPAAEGAAEAAAAALDQRCMVELVQRMLTWDSHERIAPAAALRHPFISAQELALGYGRTRYCQLALRGLRLALAGDERGAGMQGAITQLDDLSLAEPGMEGPPGLLGDGARPGTLEALGCTQGCRAACPNPRARPEPPVMEPIQAQYGLRHGSTKSHRPARHTRSDPAFEGWRSPGDERSRGSAVPPEPASADDQSLPKQQPRSPGAQVPRRARRQAGSPLWGSGGTPGAARFGGNWVATGARGTSVSPPPSRLQRAMAEPPLPSSSAWLGPEARLPEQGSPGMFPYRHHVASHQ
ncbi:homeodomain-interacting protein kinase 4 [Alligator mississippiensis]|uniref:homeodomain-interacting protein kinase 4 n=1 Tax=Alligator mississippiensis TaxID=8496 RepID=UPI0028772D1A|nr:homeodomain-interacting protein kinase 4 [Alligator mississippiensis]